ncbi:MAG: hypothetical protein HY730_08560 [Candidatus Tectomicrobia bacterium]|uniref:Uncharacterized protein n=1 Tax=Tectimicrobiota bacterium TaxID=2528274 RepID=A0A933GMZ8_UNCTE|nr:hypothetical protein [Candidatus Tectomicrobia bacterium]
MNREEIQKKIEEAKQLVGGDPKDPLTQVAFGEVFRVLLQQSSPSTVAERRPGVAVSAQQMQISEFLARPKVTSDTDRVTAILYHSLKNDQSSSTRAEILQAYSSARTRQPKNLSDVLARCIRKGHVIEAREQKDGQKAWQITLTGERYVEEKLLGG